MPVARVAPEVVFEDPVAKWRREHEELARARELEAARMRDRSRKCCAISPSASADLRRQIEEMLRDQPERVGRFASYSMQVMTMHLKPWQCAPAWIEDADRELRASGADTHGRKAAAALVQELRAAGLSIYEPDPIRAIAEAEAAKRRQAEPKLPGLSHATRPPD